MFNLNSAEKSKQVAPKTKANKFPFNSSIAFQTTTIVSAPNRAGKNRIQNRELPKNNMILETQEVTGGTEIKPHAKWCA